jgi:fructokinase
VQQARVTATVSYDPNARPSLMGSPDEVRPRMEAFIALADVVKASDEDIAWLYPDRFVPDVLRHWGMLGASVTVVTRGGEGALYALNHVGSVAHCEARGEGLVDTVGAGDSFMAGLLSGLLDAGLLGGPDARERLREASLDQVRPAVERAVTTGGLTVSRAGAYSPTRRELDLGLDAEQGAELG